MVGVVAGVAHRGASLLRDALGIALALALLVHVAAHVAIVYGLARDGAYVRAALAFVVPPLAPLWAWSHRMRRRAYLWTSSLAAFAAGVALAA